MSSPRTLRSWFLSTTAKPIYAMIGFMIAMQFIFALYQNRVKTEAVKVSARNLTNIISVGLFQQNRLIIETSSAYAMTNSGFYRICILEGEILRYSIPFSTEEYCGIESSLFLETFDVPLESLPGFKMKFVALRFPQWKDSIFLLIISAIVCFPLYGVLVMTVRKLDAHLITPLKTSVESLQADSEQRKNVESFDIVELDDLMSAYLGKIDEIRELTERESSAARDAAVGRIISQLSHDMRAPLGAVEQLLHLPSDTLVSSQTAQIRESLYRLNSMIESLRHADLELLVEPRPSRLNLSAGLSQFDAKAKIKGVSLRLADSCADLLLAIDPIKFERAWLNLLSNAVDAAKSEVKVVSNLSGQDLILQVIDDGLGVPEEVIPHLFKRGATFGKAEGTGLGLAYVHHIIGGHGGTVNYYRYGNHTVFECVLPHAIVKEQAGGDMRSIKDIRGNTDCKHVAICLEPQSLAVRVLTELTSLKTAKFLFSCEYDGADAVVSNSQDLLLKAMDDNKEFIQVKEGLPIDKILDRLTRKFNLV